MTTTTDTTKAHKHDWKFDSQIRPTGCKVQTVQRCKVCGKTRRINPNTGRTIYV